MHSTRHRENLKKIRASQKRMKEFLKDKTKSEMREILKDLASQYLSGLNKLALRDEHYEICQVVMELMNERAQDQIPHRRMG